jgi:hypothetical protein
MANTYSQIYIQAIFAVEQRAALIQPAWKEELFKYVGGIFRNKKQKLIAIGGWKITFIFYSVSDPAWPFRI